MYFAYRGIRFRYLVVYSVFRYLVVYSVFRYVVVLTCSGFTGLYVYK